MKALFIIAKTNEVKIKDDVSCVPYNPDEHKNEAYKFIGWEAPEHLLLIGEKNSGFHPTLLSNAKLSGVICPERAPDEVGDCKEGKIIDWFSTGFDIFKRPNKKLRARISTVLQMEDKG